jgi:hypothetical protein
MQRTELERMVLRRERRFTWFVYYPSMALTLAGLISACAYIFHFFGLESWQAIVLGALIAALFFQWTSYSVRREMDRFSDED